MTRLLNLLVTVFADLACYVTCCSNARNQLVTVETDDLWLALRGWPPSPACDDYAARLSTLTNQKRGAPLLALFEKWAIAPPTPELLPMLRRRRPYPLRTHKTESHRSPAPTEPTRLANVANRAIGYNRRVSQSTRQVPYKMVASMSRSTRRSPAPSSNSRSRSMSNRRGTPLRWRWWAATSATLATSTSTLFCIESPSPPSASPEPLAPPWRFKPAAK